MQKKLEQWYEQFTTGLKNEDRERLIPLVHPEFLRKEGGSSIGKLCSILMPAFSENNPFKIKIIDQAYIAEKERGLIELSISEVQGEGKLWVALIFEQEVYNACFFTKSQEEANNFLAGSFCVEQAFAA